ncbi:hypothetical protein SKAU_G00341870 [Synaphobranchus kaupii]|uniref:RING-type E3 ubiquitin transferase n=1 Tax=Synaphobranchus kaupii TaxID=118154 RepID=A0A9Q1IJI1_SYNKA|nr:hypothetical protein SKAU_G00341870 [Synaphobranchus kaupii]
MSARDPSAAESVSACPVCTERYDERRRRPKLLGCGHTFCLSCLREIAGQGDGGARDGGLPCPVCRRATALPGPGVTHLADNFAVIGFISGGSGGGRRGLCDAHPDEKTKFFCLSCHRLLCCYCALKHKSQAPHHNIESAESAALQYREKIGFALDYCREKQTFLDKLVQDSAYERRQLDGLSLSLEHLVNNSCDVELLSQGRTLAGLEGCAPPRPPPPDPSGPLAPLPFWGFGSFRRTDNKSDHSGNFSPPTPDPDGPDSPVPASERRLSEDASGGGAAQPVGVAVAPDGAVLVTERGGRGVRALDLHGNRRTALKWALEAEAGGVRGRGRLRAGRLFSVRLGWRHPFGVGVTRSSRVVVSDCCESGTLSVLTVDWTSGSVLHHQRIGGLRRPSFLACGDDDAVAVSASGSVHLYDGTGALIWRSGPDQGIFLPTGVAVDSEHNVIVADRASGKVVLLSQDGRLLRCVVQGLKGPQGLALSPDGVLVIADYGTNTVLTHPYLPAHTPPQPTAFID